MAKSYRWVRSRERVQCAKGSIRTIPRGNGLLRICCPKGPGHWNGKTCSVGTRAYEYGTPKRK